MGQELARRGYDVVGLDRRGFGYSEGRRGIVEYKQIMVDDTLAFTEKINEKFGGPDVPHFSIGNSMGGAVQVMISSQQPDLFKGMVLTVPYIGIDPKQQAELDRVAPLARFIKYFMPYKFKEFEKPLDKTYI